MDDHIGRRGAARQRVHLDQRIERIHEQDVGRAAIGGERRVVHFDGLVVVKKLRAGRLGHRELRGDAG
ncbi:MAG: hypothetical protein P4L00_01370, partial [Candidatus Acidoferrales bacterium]|nr:hypothetical protein [Candidatus Acidoferrales bacterium]